VSAQLDLFGAEIEADPAAHSTLSERRAEALALAARLSPLVRLGTSSWSFPGWRGLVYSGEPSPAMLAREGLREYARYPLFRTVGIDRSYYAPVPVEDYRRYADQLPDEFLACIKAPQSVTARVHYASGGAAAANETFMSPERLCDDLLEPLDRAFDGHAGPIILEFAPTPRTMPAEPRRFAERLDRLLAALPRRFRYAVELRDRELLTTEYGRVLASHGAGHVYNYWTAMPMPLTQTDVVPVEDMPFLVVRLLLRPGTLYEDQRKEFRPFNRLVAPDPRMREDVVTLVRRAAELGREGYVIVNNKAEGSSPLTVDALARLLAGLPAGPDGR
jgi:uncharacterized protein YecE (DUF72 family)